ncbi:MAG: winged helix-turn-helix domain-containing protein, partial [Pseudomonadales bacterium]|nr:winged helix-turn-helix domain-containing protein [Pseudomonadales bacterium]
MSRADSEFRLGEWVVVPDRHVLVAPGDERRLEPKAMETLLYLSQRAGETVTRDELIQQVWKNTWGTDEVLSRIISILRSQLGDDSRNPRFIETIPKVGYRLLVTPQAVVENPQVPTAPKAGRGWIPVVSLAVAAALILVIIPGRQGIFEEEAAHTVAVVPFRDLSPDGRQEFFAVGLTDELILRLGRFPGLRVVSRRSLGSDTADVDFYIEGNVMLANDKIRVFSELSSDEGLSLWSESYESSPTDYLDLQRGISDLIVKKLDSHLGLRTENNPEPDVDPDTYTAYLQGNFLSRLRGEASLRAGIESYRHALDRQPDFDRARLGLARALVLLPYYSGDDERRS